VYCHRALDLALIPMLARTEVGPRTPSEGPGVLMAAKRMGPWRAFRSAVVAALCGAACGEPPVAPACAALSDTATWQFLGLEEAAVHSLARTDRGVVAGTHRLGMWHTSCATRNAAWSQRGLADVLLRSIAVTQGRPERLFVAAAGAGEFLPTSALVFMSIDGGRTWSPRDSGLAAKLGGAESGASVVADSATPGRIVVGLGNGIMVSSDYGISWPRTFGSDIAVVASVDALAITHAPGGTRIWAGGMKFDTNGVTYYSDDGGLTWHPTTSRPGDLNGENNGVISLLSDPTDRNHLYAGLPNGLWETRDAGTTWRELWRTPRVGHVFALLTIGLGLVAVTNEYEFGDNFQIRQVMGVYLSHDAGESWNSLSVPDSAKGAYSAIAESGSTILIGTAAGVWRMRLP